MKKLLIILIAIAVPSSVDAKGSGGGVHFEENPLYNCSVAKKPETPHWITGIKKEKLNDRMVTLTWDDSKRAHDVEIKINGKTKKSADDSREKIKNLKNGKVYSFQVRGVSNCGKSKWSPIYKALP